jgi:hypothetical protein
MHNRHLVQKELAVIGRLAVLGAIAAAAGVLLFARPGFSQTAAASGSAAAAAQESSIRPFHANISDEVLADLRRRIAATRWPDRETVSDRS